MSQALVRPLAQAAGLMPRGKSRSCAELCGSSERMLLHPSTSHCPHGHEQEWRRDTAQLQGKEAFPKMGKPAGERRSVSPDNGGVQVLNGRDAPSNLLIPS